MNDEWSICVSGTSGPPDVGSDDELDVWRERSFLAMIGVCGVGEVDWDADGTLSCDRCVCGVYGLV